MTIDLDELERLAKAATPGSWEKRWDGTLGRATVFADGLTITVHRRGYGNIAPEGAFIAAANPQTVLALIERLRLLEGIVRDLANPRTWGGSSWCRFCIGCVLGRDREAPEPEMMGMFIHDDSCPYRRACEAKK